MLTQRRAVKQRRMVLDVTTALEPNLTFFTAVELADVLDMDIKIEVVPRGALAGIARPDERRGAANPQTGYGRAREREVLRHHRAFREARREGFVLAAFPDQIGRFPPSFVESVDTTGRLVQRMP